MVPSLSANKRHKLIVGKSTNDNPGQRFCKEEKNSVPPFMVHFIAFNHAQKDDLGQPNSLYLLAICILKVQQMV